MVDYFAWTFGIIIGFIIGFIIGKVYTNFRRIMKQSEKVNKKSGDASW